MTEAERLAEVIETIARALCEYDDRDPDEIEGGNVIVHPTDDLEKWCDVNGVFIDTLADNETRPPDGYTRKGEKGHFFWRRYIGEAQVAAKPLLARIAALEEALRFYARENCWRSSGMYMSGKSQASQAELDRGEKARKALGKGSE